MPKNRNVVKKDGVTHRYNVASKFRIGNRKTGKAANTMSNEALQAVLDSKGKARYHANARTVLATRGVV